MRLIKVCVHDDMTDATSTNTNSRPKLQTSGVSAFSIFEVTHV